MQSSRYSALIGQNLQANYRGMFREARRNMPHPYDHTRQPTVR
jgi:hypothetical protein